MARRKGHGDLSATGELRAGRRLGYLRLSVRPSSVLPVESCPVPASPPKNFSLWMGLLVIGISMNSLGVSLSRLGAVRFIFMGVGLLLLIVAFVGLLRSRQR